MLHLVLAHDAGLPEVELHWRVHWYEGEFGAAGARARAARVPTACGACDALDDLAALLLYHARDGLAGLRHPIDVAAWWDAHGDALGRPLLAPIADEHPALRARPAASAAVLDGLVGVPAGRLVATVPRTWGACAGPSVWPTP